MAKCYTEYRKNYIERQEEREKIEQVKREQEEHERKAKAQEERERKLLQAEETLRSRQTLQNEEFEDSTIVLALMERHNIEVPLRTQGWINKALAMICFNQEGITYKYYSCSSDSKVFWQYLSLLEEKVEKGELPC